MFNVEGSFLNREVISLSRANSVGVNVVLIRKSGWFDSSGKRLSVNKSFSEVGRY